jgi:hypothetical protein
MIARVRAWYCNLRELNNLRLTSQYLERLKNDIWVARIIMPYRYPCGGSPFQLFGSGKRLGSVNFGKLAQSAIFRM